MTRGLRHNHDLSAAFADLITQTSASWVMADQPAAWLPLSWQRQWQMNSSLPHPEVIDELQDEYATHQRIRRSFVFSFQERSPAELFIAAMAWGYGNDPRGPSKAQAMLTPGNAVQAIEAVVNIVRQKGAAAAYSKYFSDWKLPQLSTSFITKLLYFAGYEFATYNKQEQNPRPLIYDRRVATAVTRLPEAPLLPSTWVSTSSYRCYCEWAEQTAANYGTEPFVLEWALFQLGGQVRQVLRT